MNRPDRKDIPIQIRELDDPMAEERDRTFWASKTREDRLSAMEVLRQVGLKFIPFDEKNGNNGRLRRVLRVSNREEVGRPERRSI